MKNKILIIIAILISLNSCNKPKNTKKEMEEIVEEIYKQVHTYTSRPLYSVQVDKTGCRMFIEIKGNVDYGFTENNGESMTLPLNFFITKSGLQTAIIKIYPKAGDLYITKFAMANLTFYYAPDKDTSINEYKEIAKYSLPKELEEQKLPYYEAQVTFDAQVPFDYSKILTESQDLTKISDIESKVVKKYNDLAKIIHDLDKLAYEKNKKLFSLRVFESNYETDKNVIRNEVTDTLNIFNSTIVNREMLPIINYKIQYYAGNKIVALWNVKNLECTLRLKGKFKKKDGSIINYEVSDPLFLYMPTGSNELKVW